MLKLILPNILFSLILWVFPQKWFWPMSLFYMLLLAILNTPILYTPPMTPWALTNLYLSTDPLSSPLLVLTLWLMPLMILASQNHLKTETFPRQRSFLFILTLLHISLILAFSALNALLFYIMFEATLIPTLMIITRWGNQTERISAGTYFLFYTIISSMPLLIVLLVAQKDLGSLSFPLIQQLSNLSSPTFSNNLWWLACMMAFLVKMPLYGIHLWLPKAHVEAPIAGSMVLAAILLKLGGYGMIRILPLIKPLPCYMAYPFIILAIWGIIMTSSICLCQMDLKALIAYSSVSHMGLVIASILIQTQWSLTGATILMIAHGFTSSALFCLANTNYERTHSRTMLLTRGLQVLLPLMSAWWLLTCLLNLALPPTINLVAELTIISSLFKWSPWTLLFTGGGVLVTAAYSLSMFLVTQRGPAKQEAPVTPSHSREHLLLALHILPVLLLSLKPSLTWGLFL
uniref:NADH-ubiquinone oxidoreductase chain 4 n=1 Tax=Porichthys myriaster TaxID=262771 RepID=Q5GM84_9TELE|nr:NADH dehydrogenase subunit 4 [Porichthys myriaster]